MLSKRLLGFIVMLLALALVLPCMAAAGPLGPVAVNDTVSQSLARFVAGDRAVGDQFGYSIAVSGNTAVVGARESTNSVSPSGSGAAYVFQLVGGVWTQQQKLTASDGAIGDRFGGSVAIDGPTILVGAPYNSENGTHAGAVYVFDLSGSTWSQSAKLVASDGAVDDLFGASVSIDANTAAVGAYHANADTGSAYVFDRVGTVWSQTQELTDVAGALGNRFGRSVAISGGTLMVGAPGLDPPSPQTTTGKVCVFTHPASTWAQGADLAPIGPTVGARFGGSLLLSNTQALVGAWGPLGIPTYYVFAGSGATWSQTSVGTFADGPMNEFLASSFAVAGGSTVVGSATEEQSTGAAYAYGPKVSLVTNVNTALTVAAPGVLVNDYDLTGASLVATQATAPSHGTVALALDGGFVYTPDEGFTGTDTFTYEAWNGTSYSGIATVTVKVLGPVWRFRNNKMIGNYLWTPDPAEKASIMALLSGTWVYEGQAFSINPSNPLNSSPLWRFRNKRDWTYFYTADPVEKANIVNNLSDTWILEGPAWNISLAPTPVPVWRFRCLRNSTHLWTSDPNEKLTIQTQLTSDYALEGIAYYIGQ